MPYQRSDQIDFLVMGECDGSEVVIRFSPFLADRLLENAQGTFDEDLDEGRPPRYGVSVVAGTCEDGGDIDEAIERILSQTQLGGKQMAVITGTELRAAGFELVKDPTTLEPLHHLVGDHPFTEPPRVDVLASLLHDRRRRNPAYKRGAA